MFVKELMVGRGVNSGRSSPPHIYASNYFARVLNYIEAMAAVY